MPARPRRRLRRGVVLAAVVVVLAGAAVAGVALWRSRQVERSAEALCVELAEARDLDDSMTTLDPTTLDPQVAALRRASDVAPADVAPSVGTLSDFVAEVADEVARSDGDRGDALVSALEARQDQVDAVSAAGAEVERWAAANCGFTLSGDTPPDDPPLTGADDAVDADPTTD